MAATEALPHALHGRVSEMKAGGCTCPDVGFSIYMAAEAAGRSRKCRTVRLAPKCEPRLLNQAFMAAHYSHGVDNQSSSHLLTNESR